MSETVGTSQPPRNLGSWGARMIANRRVRLACYLVCVGVFAANAMFGDLTDHPMVGDELCYAGIIDRMQADGNWIHPTISDRLPYLNKPPLYFWLSTLTYDWLGEGILKYRFWSASFGVGCALLTVLLGARLFGPEAGGLAGYLLAENDVFLRHHGAQIGVFDALITFFAGLCFWFYWTMARRQHGWRGWTGWLLVGISAAAISMLKPAWGIPFVGVVSVHYLWTGKHWIDFRRLQGPILAALVSVAIVAPWYALQWERYGEQYTNAIFWANYIRRADGTLHPHHIAPPWFYLEAMSRSSFRPFLPLLAVCIGLAVRGRNRPELRFALFVTCSTVAILSLSEAKLPWYVFPVYPLAASLMGAASVWIATQMINSFERRTGLRLSLESTGTVPTILRLPERAPATIQQPKRRSA